MKHLPTTLLSLLLTTALAAQTTTTVSLEPSKDNTLFESSTGALSGGKGDVLVTGRLDTLRGGGLRRRAVLAFDIRTAVPACSKINSVVLTMTVTRSASSTNGATAVHRLTKDWGEGTSTFSNNGKGAASTTGDVTWIHTFFSTSKPPKWSSAGGDFASTASTTTTVTTSNSYTFSSNTMTSDVQAWLDKPATNFGWILITDESVVKNARLWGSREDTTVASRPKLTITYTPPKASVLSIGTGCAGLGTKAYTLATTGGLPTVPNSKFGLAVTGGPTNKVHIFAAGPLLGAPVSFGRGCLLRISPFLVIIAPATSIPTGIPNSANLLGLQIPIQAATDDSGGLVFSNVLVLKIGK